MNLENKPDTTQAGRTLSPPSRERVYRRNFIYFLADNILFSVAMGIINPTTVIPDFVRQLTSSEILIGLCGSLWTIGFTLPQLFVARHVVGHERKKWWFVGPNIPVRFAILIFALITVWLGSDRPQLILLAFFACYGFAALGDGIVGVPWADLAGTSLDNRWRARMFGLTIAISSVILLLLAPQIGRVLGDAGRPFPNNYAVLFGAAGLLFVVSIVPGFFFHELPGGKAAEKPLPFSDYLPDLGRVLRDDAPFRAFTVTRIFTSLFKMAAPFYIGYATVQLGLSSDVAVPVLLVMQTLGSVAGALAYVWLGARSPLLYIRLALWCAALLPVCALLAAVAGPLPLYFGFLLSGLTTSNLMSAYLDWLVGYAGADRRPVYVGLSNTVTAGASFVAPIIGGALAASLGYLPLFAVSLVMTLAALFGTRFMPERHAAEAREAAVSSTPA
jgi:MFS family permease